MQAGTLLAQRYRIDGKLGEGGMGVVFKAHDTLLNRAVAVKALTPALLGPEGVARLIREAQAAAQLTHPNIVGVYDVINDSDARLIVMEYVEGRTLAELIPQDISQAVDLLIQVCRALQYAHTRGIIHRDIKPENIVMTSDGVAKVMDFGLARSEGRTRLTQTGLIVGTVAYMAPEQILGGTVDARTDLYSLGCVAYELLTGRKPFEGEDAFTILSQHVNVTPVAPRWHNPAIPPTLDAIVTRLLAKDPAERYASAEDVISALELTGEAEAQTGEPVEVATRATLLERIVRGKLVGRDKELRELREHLDRMLSGEGRLVLISGEPGIGKTRLAEELAVYAHLRGSQVLRGHCYEQEVGVPYLPFVESLRQLLHISGPRSLEELGEAREDLARLLPDAVRRTAETAILSPEDERIRVFDAVTQWITQASHRHPLVFILDDVHWADRASLRLLHHLARSLRDHRVLVLGTYREMELDLEHPLNDTLSQMNRERLFYRLPLRRLTEDDTRALLSGLFDTDISTELAGAVYQETEGNPFFIEEVVKALVEEGKIYREAGRWQRLEIEELEIPQSVKAAIGRRIQKASEPARRVLTIAAVIGREFNIDVVVRVSGLNEDTVLDTLDEATRLQLIEETRIGKGQGYTFEHALIRQTLYDGLNARRRARLHQQVGEALEVLYQSRRDDHVEELAHHFGEAGPAVAPKGIEYNLEAAQKAASLHAMEEGERRLAVALELAESQDATIQGPMHEALGDLYLLFGDARASEAYQRALDLREAQGDRSSDDILRLYCRIAEASAGWEKEGSPEALRYTQRAVDLLQDKPDTPLKSRALSLLAIHHTRAGNPQQGLQPAEQAVQIAMRLGDEQALSLAYRALAMVYRYSNEWDQMGEVVQKRKALLGTALTAADVDLYVDIVFNHLVGGRFAEAERAGREFLALAEKFRSPTAVYRACSLLCSACYHTNRWDEASEFGERVIELVQRLHGLSPWGMSVALFRIGTMLIARGEEDVARARIAQLVAMEYNNPPEHASARTFALDLALMLKDSTLASSLLQRVEQEQPRCLSCRFTFHLRMGCAYLLLGDIDAAQARLDTVERNIPEGLAPLDLADLANFRGLVAETKGDLGMAVHQREEALRITSGWPMWLDKAIDHEETGRVYLARNEPGDQERGEALLREAINFYRQVGARRFEHRVMVVSSQGATS